MICTSISPPGRAVETPVPMDDDLDEPAEGGYGPIRRKGTIWGSIWFDLMSLLALHSMTTPFIFCHSCTCCFPGEASENGIIFQPAEVEDVVIETVDESKAEGDSDMPYSKPQFPALTPIFSCKKKDCL